MCVCVCVCVYVCKYIHTCMLVFLSYAEINFCIYILKPCCEKSFCI